jgi:hypothetical protein
MTDNTKTDNARTREAHDAYVANRKEAGRVIDIETCKYTRCYTNYSIPTEPTLGMMIRRMMRCPNNAGAMYLNAGSYGATKATAGSRRMIYRKRSGKRCNVGWRASLRAVQRTTLRRMISRSENAMRDDIITKRGTLGAHERRSNAARFGREASRALLIFPVEPNDPALDRAPLLKGVEGRCRE